MQELDQQSHDQGKRFPPKKRAEAKLLRERITDLERHVKLTRTQREHYNHTKETLPMGEAVIIMDFVGFEFTQSKC